MKIVFLSLFLAISQLTGAQLGAFKSLVLNQDEKAINQNPDVTVFNETNCEFDINNFTGLYSLTDVDYPTIPPTPVTITIDPETENGLIIKSFWSAIFGSDTATEAPFKVILSDINTITWEEQSAVPELYSYGQSWVNAGSGSYNPCSYVMNINFKICVEEGCLSNFRMRLEPSLEVGEPEDYFWVGGSGNWYETDHWATSSGGSVFHDKFPDQNDNVYFDNLSSGSEDYPIIVGETALCGNFNYSSPVEMEFSLSDLKIYESFNINNTIIPKIGNLFLMDDNSNDFKTFNKQFNNINFFGSGPFTVIDTLNAYIVNIRGAVKLSPVTQCTRINVEDASNLDISHSHVYVVNFILDLLPVNFNSVNSTIFLSGSLEGTGYTFNKIIVSHGSLSAPNKVDTLQIIEGSTLFMEAFETIEVKKLIAIGKESKYSTIRGNNSYILNSTGVDTIKYVLLDDVHAIGMAEIYAPDCILKNGSSGWRGAKYYQEIYYNMIENVPVTEESVSLQAASSSGLTVFMKLIRGDGNLDNNVFYPQGKGMVEIEFSQQGGENDYTEYAPAKSISAFFQVIDENVPFEIYDFKEASMIIGQENFDVMVNAVDSLHFKGSYKCAVSSKDMFAVSTVDKKSGRILLWKSIPDQIGQPADIVLGRSGFNDQVGGTSASLMSNSRGLVFSHDGNKLLVSDGHRILIWNSIPETSGTAADVVIGANDFEDNGSENIGVSANRFGFISDLLVTPDGKLIVCDRLRVLIFNSIPEVNNASADVVIFQPDFTSEETGISNRRINGPFIRQVALSNRGKLFVAVPGDDRVLVFNQIPVVNDTPADYVLGSSDMFSLRLYNDGLNGFLGSNGIAVSSDNIAAVSCAGWSIGYSRILLYKGLPSRTDQLPTHILGQPNFEDIFNQGTSRRAIESSIEGLTFDTKGHLYVCFRFSPKILVFNLKDETYTKGNINETDEDLLIYPNPSDGFFIIKNNARNPVDKVMIYNVQGMLVYNQTFNDVTSEINLNPNLSHGFYMVKIQSGNRSIVKKLIIR